MGTLFDHDQNTGEDGSCTTYLYTIVAGHVEFFEQLVHAHTEDEARYGWWLEKGDAYFEEFCRVVSTYQEQPHLLDVVLKRVVGVLSSVMIDCVRRQCDDSQDTNQVLAYVSRFLWKLSSVRGYKTVVRCLPTDVYYVEPLFRFLGTRPQPSHAWECEYCVLLWSYHLALIPFQFDVIDSGGASMIDHIIQVCKERLYAASTVREMAALCLGRLLTRPDMTASLIEFGGWAREILDPPARQGDIRDAQFIIPGIMLTMATIFKIGKPTDDGIKSLALVFMPRAVALFESAAFERNQLVRTLSMKIVQRAALISIIGYEDIESEEVQNALGVAVHVLLRGLCDKDTVVRWSSAKGIARVASKLDTVFVEQIMEALLDMMNSLLASENTWHGGCLAIAEMTRRNMIPGSSIPDLVPLIQQGLTYEVRRGYSSVGNNVRDAAAYICWSLARTQTKDDMRAAFRDLAPVLMTSACYDREINCRRAAAAAFQECVGRLGNVPDGIDILTIADFFSVSLRNTAYLQVAPQVAAFPGYHAVFAHHLLEKKLIHWEKTTRELAAQALAALVSIDVEFHKTVSMRHLMKQCSSNILENRHGAVYALACILPELFAHGNDSEWLDLDTQNQVSCIIGILVSSGVAKGIGAEVMRGALCCLVFSMSQVNIQLSAEELLCIYGVCRENISHPSEDVQIEAAKALSGILDVYVRRESCPLKESDIVDAFIQDLHPSLHYGVRRGAALAFGKFPTWLIARYPRIIDAILTSLHLENNTAVADVESRVYAIQSIPHVLEFAINSNDFDRIGQSLDSLLVALEDYSTDNRGDIGSWVREAAAISAVDILCMCSLAAFEPSLVTKSRLLVCKIIRLTIERIGRVRQNVGRCLQRCIEQNANDLNLDIVAQYVPKISEDDFLDGKAFSQIIQCCHGNDAMILTEIVIGAIYAIGGLDISLQEFTSEHMVAFLDQATQETRAMFKDSVLSVWHDMTGTGRLAISWIHTVDVLLSRTAYIQDEDFVAASIQRVESMSQASGDVPKLCKIAQLLGTIAEENIGSHTNHAAITLLIRLLGKKYPRVRTIAAEQLYTAMLLWDDDDVPNLQQACAILEETPWQGPASIVRPAREQLSSLLGIPP